MTSGGNFRTGLKLEADGTGDVVVLQGMCLVRWGEVGKKAVVKE